MNVKNFFDAEYAHKMTDEIVNNNLEKDLNYVYEQIEIAMNKGQYKCQIDFGNKKISKDLISKLKENKFTVDIWRGCQRDPANDLVINW